VRIRINVSIVNSLEKPSAGTELKSVQHVSIKNNNEFLHSMDVLTTWVYATDTDVKNSSSKITAIIQTSLSANSATHELINKVPHQAYEFRR
jgi:hypothetical protein